MSGHGESSQSTDAVDDLGSSCKKRPADEDEDDKSSWKFRRSQSPCSTSGFSGRSSATAGLAGGAGGRGSGAKARRLACETAIKHAEDAIIDPAKAYRAALNRELMCGRLSCMKVYTIGDPWSSLLEIQLEDGTQMKIGIRDMCWDCGQTYKAFETQGPWEMIKLLCNTVPEMDAKFKAADVARNNEIEKRSWAKKEYRIEKAKKSGMRVTIIYWGLTTQEFFLIFDIDYANVGLTILNLKVPGSSEKFQGVVIRDHPRIRALALGIKIRVLRGDLPISRSN